MNTATDSREKLIESLRDPEYRHHFASAVVRRGIAEQLRETRLSRGWTQERLARESGKVQETISQLEDPNYGSYTYKTLERLAKALDVALIVRLAPYSELADWIENLSPEDLAVPDFEHDPGLAPDATHITTRLTAGVLPAMTNETAAPLSSVTTKTAGPRLQLLKSPPPPDPFYWESVTRRETSPPLEMYSSAAD